MQKASKFCKVRVGLNKAYHYYFSIATSHTLAPCSVTISLPYQHELDYLANGGVQLHSISLPCRDLKT